MQVFCTTYDRWMSVPEYYQLRKKFHRNGPFWTGEPLDSIYSAMWHTRQAIENTKKRWPEKAAR